MSELFVLRRANGDLLTERVSGHLRVPLWSSKDAVARFKERNPELMVFLPARLNHSLMKKIGDAEFFLLSNDTPDADLDDGMPIRREELFTDDQITSQPGQAPV